jgi:hypothetical protein
MRAYHLILAAGLLAAGAAAAQSPSAGLAKATFAGRGSGRRRPR